VAGGGHYIMIGGEKCWLCTGITIVLGALFPSIQVVTLLVCFMLVFSACIWCLHCFLSLVLVLLLVSGACAAACAPCLPTMPLARHQKSESSSLQCARFWFADMVLTVIYQDPLESDC
jgi:hypothetical protein